MQQLVASGEARISEHGYDELADDGITAREVVSGIHRGFLIEEYPDYPKGPSLLVLQKTIEGDPIHVVWGIPKNHHSPVVLITAYRPDPSRWDQTLTRRK